jgi:hypothetical protein
VLLATVARSKVQQVWLQLLRRNVRLQQPGPIWLGLFQLLHLNWPTCWCALTTSRGGLLWLLSRVRLLDCSTGS